MEFPCTEQVPHGSLSKFYIAGRLRIRQSTCSNSYGYHIKTPSYIGECITNGSPKILKNSIGRHWRCFTSDTHLHNVYLESGFITRPVHQNQNSLLETSHFYHAMKCLAGSQAFPRLQFDRKPSEENNT